MSQLLPWLMRVAEPLHLHALLAAANDSLADTALQTTATNLLASLIQQAALASAARDAQQAEALVAVREEVATMRGDLSAQLAQLAQPQPQPQQPPQVAQAQPDAAAAARMAAALGSAHAACSATDDLLMDAQEVRLEQASEQHRRWVEQERVQLQQQRELRRQRAFLQDVLQPWDSDSPQARQLREVRCGVGRR